MTNPVARRQSKSNLDKLGNTPERMTMTRGSVPSQDQIRDRAYQLYENRGRRAGHEEQDWLRAEREILERSNK